LDSSFLQALNVFASFSAALASLFVAAAAIEQLTAEVAAIPRTATTVPSQALRFCTTSFPSPACFIASELNRRCWAICPCILDGTESVQYAPSNAASFLLLDVFLGRSDDLFRFAECDRGGSRPVENEGPEIVALGLVDKLVAAAIIDDVLLAIPFEG
jgi:hypothetical protein